MAAAMMAVGTIGGAACGDDDEGGPPTGTTCESGSTLTYESFGETFMLDYCVSCHDSAKTGALRQDAPKGVDFDTIEGVRKHLKAIDAYAAAGPKGTNDEMPPPEEDEQPTLSERQQLGEWISCGAPSAE